MKHLLTIATLLALAMPALSQRGNCNPTRSQDDKFTKKKLDTWFYWIEGTSFGEMMWKTNHVNVAFGGQINGEENFLIIKASVWDKSAQSATYGGKIEGAVGNSFYLAFDDDESLEFKATTCENKSDYNTSAKVYEHSVFYSVKIADEDVSKLKERFASHRITAARFQLLNGINLDQNFVEKHSVEMQRIITCFFDRVKIQSPAQQPQPTSIQASQAVKATYNMSAHTEFKAFWTDFQKAAGSNDIKAISDMTSFPFRDGNDAYGTAGSLTSKDATVFAQNFNKIFPQLVKDAVAKSSYRSYDENSDGEDVIEKGDYLLIVPKSSARSQDLVFKRMNGVYKLNRIQYYP